jgi:DNA polymerase-3 subunit beta
MMKITITRDEMQKKLGDVQNIVDKKTVMPILSHCLLEVGGQGAAVYATDLETAIKEPVQLLGSDREGSWCIPAKKLYEISKEVDEDIVIEEDEVGWIKLKSGKSNFRIACMNADDYPRWPVIEEKKTIGIKASVLLSMIDKTLYCAGETDNRYAFNALLFHIDGTHKLMTLVGTDGHRLAVITKPVNVDFEDEIKVIVPRKAVTEIRKFIAVNQDDITFDVTDKYVRFNLGEVVFLTKIIEGMYPNYEQAVPRDNDKKAVMEREPLMKSLRRVSLMSAISKEKSKVVRVDIGEGQMNIFAVDMGIGEANESLNVEYEGETLTLGFNAKYMLDCLLSMETDRVVALLKDGLSPVLMKEEGSEDYRCVVMPMRI